MSAALQAARDLRDLTRLLLDRANASGKTDAWFAERLGCGREQFNRIRNGRASLKTDQVFALSVLVGVRVRGVIVEAQGE
jgi:hypothetical protein